MNHYKQEIKRLKEVKAVVKQQHQQVRRALHEGVVQVTVQSRHFGLTITPGEATANQLASDLAEQLLDQMQQLKRSIGRCRELLAQERQHKAQEQAFLDSDAARALRGLAPFPPQSQA